MKRIGTTTRARRVAAMSVISSKKIGALGGDLRHLTPADDRVDYWVGEK
jgi:hypothetical protein